MIGGWSGGTWPWLAPESATSSPDLPSPGLSSACGRQVQGNHARKEENSDIAEVHETEAHVLALLCFHEAAKEGGDR